MPRTSSMRYRCNCGGALYVKETRASDEAIYRVRKCRHSSGHVAGSNPATIKNTRP